MQPKALHVTVMMIITLLFAPLVQAHTGTHGSGSLAESIMHPVTSLDHLLASTAAPVTGYAAGLLLLTGLLLALGVILRQVINAHRH